MSKSHKILNIPALFQPIKVTKLSKCAKPNHCQNRKNFQHNCSFSTDKVAKLSKYAKLNICQNRRNFQYTCSFSADKVAKLSKCAKFNHRQSRRNFQYTCSFSAEPRRKSLRPTSQRLGEGGAFSNARTGTKLQNSHKLSGEPMPRLRQTAR